MSGAAALQVILDSIAQGDDDVLISALDRINISKLSIEASNSLLSRLLRTAQEFNNREAVRIIVSAYEPNYTDRYDLPILCQIIMSQSIDDETAAYILSVYPEDSYMELAFRYATYDDDPDIMAGLVRLEDMRGPLSLKEYRELLNIAFEKSNTTAYDFFAYQLNEKGEYQDIPPWMRNFTREGDPNIIEEEELPLADDIIVPKEETYIFPEPENTSQVIYTLTNGIKANGKTEEDVEVSQMELRKSLAGATLEEKQLILKDTLESKAIADLASNVDYFAIFGPANLQVGAQLSNEDSFICSKYGGCRMFTCIEFEDFLDPETNVVYPIEDYSPQEWFTGACQWCHRRIRRPWHAIRLPLDHGGWQGCYCSPECIQDSLGEEEVETGEPEPLSLILLDRFVEDLNTIGIQDRL